MQYTEDGLFRVGGEGGGIFNNAIAGDGLGQLSMPEETFAKLDACMTTCDQKYGVPSGNPDFLSIVACQTNCNMQYPPTLAVPGGTYTPPPVTAETLPALLPPSLFPAAAQPLKFTEPAPSPAPVQAGMSAGTKLGLVVLALAVAGGVGYMVYQSKKAAPKARMAENRRRRSGPSRAAMRARIDKLAKRRNR